MTQKSDHCLLLFVFFCAIAIFVSIIAVTGYSESYGYSRWVKSFVPANCTVRDHYTVQHQEEIKDNWIQLRCAVFAKLECRDGCNISDYYCKSRWIEENLRCGISNCSNREAIDYCESQMSNESVYRYWFKKDIFAKVYYNDAKYLSLYETYANMGSLPWVIGSVIFLVTFIVLPFLACWISRLLNRTVVVPQVQDEHELVTVRNEV